MAIEIIEKIEIGRPDNECRLKIGDGMGSQHLFFKGEYGDFFNNVDDFFIARQDLLHYLEDAKEEFFHPSASYHLVRASTAAEKRGGAKGTVNVAVNLQDYWVQCIHEVEQLDEFTFLSFERGMTSDKNGRFYYHNDKIDNPYKILYNICIPTLKARTLDSYRSLYRLIKIKDNYSNLYYIHIIPIFNMKYNEQELTNILKRDYVGNTDYEKETKLFSFLYKYYEYIKKHDFSIERILNNANVVCNLDSIVNIMDGFLEANQDKINVYQHFANAERMYVSEEKTYSISGSPRQQIFYGAPGTGKSHEIKRQTSGRSIIRTTFHPDSDYSTFVGAYKPTVIDENRRAVRNVDGDEIGITQNQMTYTEKRISYQFVKQAFLKAYLGAWKKYSEADDTIEPQFLIIEEINRGNCAQIFGDLFQLLDRADNGFSEYPIEADTDLQKEIERSFKDEDNYKINGDIIIKEAINYNSNYGATLSEDVQHGRVLLLPPNLFIWATMNTSDQSLFPIDSAFKRRWDWEYMPIENGEKGWKIELDDRHELIDWWDFLKRINIIISELTTSEDKQLGYYFCKPDKIDSNGNLTVISSKHFVDKVIFYLWNDVFKDYAFDTLCCKGEDDKEVLFAKFYNEGEKSININTLTHFFETLKKDKEASLVKLIKHSANDGEASDEQQANEEDVNNEVETVVKDNPAE